MNTSICTVSKCLEKLNLFRVNCCSYSIRKLVKIRSYIYTSCGYVYFMFVKHQAHTTHVYFYNKKK